MENKELKEFKPTLDFITENECTIKVFCKDSKQVDLLLHTYPYYYPKIFSYEPDEILSYFEQHLFDLDDDDDKIYHNPLDAEGEYSDIEGFYDSCFSNGYTLLIGLYVKNGKIIDWYWDKVKHRKRDMSLHTEKYSMRFSQFKALLFNGLSINDTNKYMSINMDFFKRFDVNDYCYVYCDNLQQVKTLLEEYPKLFPDFFIYTDGHTFHKDVVKYLENLEIGDPNYEYYDVDSFYKSCFTDDYKLAIELKLVNNEFVGWTWCKRHIDSMELVDFDFDGFNEFFFKKIK